MQRSRSLLTLAIYLFCLSWSRFCLAQTGAVLGFGDNLHYQIGDNTNIQRLLPTPALKISGIKAVACGFMHTLALDSNGTVWAWGENNTGQLGTGDTTPRFQPVPIKGGIKAIAAGGFHSLALDFNGTVWAWGYNAQGQLGTGNFTEQHVPVRMSGGFNARIKAIAVGSYHSMLLNEKGLLYGCGNNTEGELGLGDFTNRSLLSYMNDRVVGMAGGTYHTLIQTADNDVFGAGYNAYGELGDGTTVSKNYWVHVLSNIRALSAGTFHSLAVGQNGKAYAWGGNDDGELGTGDINKRLLPTEIPGAVNIKAVAAGGYHSLLLTAGGTVLGTGRNFEGELGDGTTTARHSLVSVKNAFLIGSIAAGGTYSVILKPFTKVMATGQNIYGQLGVGDTNERDAPVPMLIASNILAVASGSANGNHSLLLRADGTVWACGLNQYGQLGNGTTNNSPVPAQVKGPNGVGVLSNIIAIAAGDNHSIALAANGNVYAWGKNDHGQLGIGSRSNFTVPVLVPYVNNVFAIAAGGQHSLLLSNQGQVYAAGLNNYGQLGFGFTDEHLFFDRIEGFLDQIAIAAGAVHSLSLSYSGEMYSWGNNYSGPLALGDNTNRYVPTRQPGTAAIAIACGGYQSLCLNGAGQAFFSGLNAFGALGLGDVATRYSWTYNNRLQAPVGLASGLYHCLDLDVFGTLSASGDGFDGQLGIGTTNNQNTFAFMWDATGHTVLGATGMAGGAFHTLVLTTPPIQVASVAVIPTTVKGGTGATGRVTLNGVAGPGGQRVALWCYTLDQNGNPLNVTSVPDFVDVPATSTTAIFPITTKAVSSKVTTYVAASLNHVFYAPLTVQP